MARRHERYHLDGLALPRTPLPDLEPEPWVEPRVVGGARPRVDAYARVSGAAVYPSDVALPGMLHGAVLRCPHPHARVGALDVSAARALPGVHVVLTPEEVEHRWTWRRDHHCALLETHCRFEGEPVAAVAAESPYLAQDALRAIQVQWEVLPAVVDMVDAVTEGAPFVHEGGHQVGETARYQRGDVESGFEAADVVLEQEFLTPAQLHTPLEPHGCVARWDGDRLTLWESTQGVYRVQRTAAELMGLPLSKVRVVGPYMGGGFGSKLAAGRYTVLAALLARHAGRPVRLFLSREETMLVAGNRPPTWMRLKAGVTRDGRLTALDMTVRGTGGAWPAGGTALVDWLVRDLYSCDNVRTEAYDVYTHTGPARPFRAPGHPQGAWALEQMMDALAEAIEVDPVQLRLRNVPTRSQGRPGAPPYTSTGLRACLEQGARAFGWGEARQRAPADGSKRRGVGVAAALWIAGAGGPPSTVVLKLFADGSASLNMGASDIGTGTKTVMAMVVAEELGVPVDQVHIEHADTDTTQFATPSGGSKTLPTEAPAVRAAAAQVKRQLIALAAEELGVRANKLDWVDGAVRDRRDGTRRELADLRGLAAQGVVVGVGYRGPNPEGEVSCPFAAQFCEVEVDTRTGEVEVLRVVAAHDSGRVINRTTFDSQVYGGVVMGIGFGCTEERVLDRGGTGRLLSRSWHDYKLPTQLDAPRDLVSTPVDLPDHRANSAGAKGLGEPVTIPTAAAVANAVYHATGRRITAAPLVPASLVGEP